MQAPLTATDFGACSGCRYNVLAPGKASVGCSAVTPSAALHAALEHLQLARPKDADTLNAILERLIEQGDALTDDEAKVVHGVAKRWWDIASSRPDEQAVISILFRFSEGALTLGERVALFV